MSPIFKQRSLVWKYFTKTNKSYVTCTLCNNVMKFFGGTTNLRHHLRRMHLGETGLRQILTLETEQENINSIDQNDSFLDVKSHIPTSTSIKRSYTIKKRRDYKNASIVWKYFKKDDNLQATCKLCSKVIRHFGGTTNLRQHLFRLHPTVITAPSTMYIKNEHFEDGEMSMLADDSRNRRRFSDTQSPEIIQIQLVGSDYEGYSQDLTTIDVTESCFDKDLIGQSEMEAISDEAYMESNNPSKTEDIPAGSDPLQDTQSSSISMNDHQYLNSNQGTQINKSEIDFRLIQMIVKDYHPPSIVENQGFIHFMHTLQPLYVLPSEKVVEEELLPKYYNAGARALQQVLNTVNSVALSTEIWNSQSEETYMTVTCHFIDKNHMESRVLSTQYIGEPLTENIAFCLSEIASKWNIDSKIVANVTQNATTENISCIAQKLHLIITEAVSSVKEFEDILEKCRALAKYIKYDDTAREKLKETQEQMDLPTLKVKIDYATRWNSAFRMIDRLLLVKESLCQVVSELSECPEILDTQEWQIISECFEVLKPTNELMNILSKEKYPRLSIVIPLVRGFQFTVQNLQILRTEVGKKFKKAILHQISCHLGNIESHEIVSKTCFLDPRFKTYGFSSEKNANEAQELILKELSDIVVLKENEYVVEDTDDKLKINSGSIDIWTHFDQKVAGIPTSISPFKNADTLVREYLNKLPLERHKNPLEFWNKQKLSMPEMYDLAMKYLCIPCTSIPTSAVYSKQGDEMQYRRSLLASEYLDEIIFLNSQ